MKNRFIVIFVLLVVTLTSCLPPPDSFEPDPVVPVPPVIPDDFVLYVSSVFASGDDGNVPENVLDDDLSTRWSSYGVGEWITFELNDTYEVQSINISWYFGDIRIAFFDLMYSEDNISWVNVYSGQSSGTTNNSENYDLQDAATRYVRIVGKGNNNSNWNSITTVVIIGKNVDENTVYLDYSDVAVPKNVPNLIFNNEELALWRDRANNGPHFTYGNPGPGDWSLIVGWKNSFMASPALWQPSITHHSQLGLRDPPLPHRQHLGAASLWALLYDDADVARKVRDQIARQARVETLNWRNRNIYPTSGSGAVPSSGNPFFDISAWMVNIGRAYLETDYLIKKGLIEDWSASDRQRIEQWFVDYAELMKNRHDARIGELFVNRYEGDYRLTTRGNNDLNNYDQGYTHAGGYPVNRFIHFYNNREAQNVRTIGFIGAMFKDHPSHGSRASEFMNTARLHVVETLRYASIADDAQYTTGYEYYRSSLSGDRTTGYGYEASHISSLISIVWDLGRVGYWDGREFSTTLGSGAHNNPLVGNQPKSIRNRMRVFSGISDANAPTHIRHRHAANMQGNSIGQMYMSAHWFTMSIKSTILWPDESFVNWYILTSNYENSKRHWGPQDSYYEGDHGANTGYKSMNGAWGNDVALYWKIVGFENRNNPFPAMFDNPVGSE